MNTRNIQTFLMVSAAFFAMSAPVRSASTNTLANAVALTTKIAPACVGAECVAPSSKTDEDERRS
jgi:hypothetical protein